MRCDRRRPYRKCACCGHTTPTPGCSTERRLSTRGTTRTCERRLATQARSARRAGSPCSTGQQLTTSIKTFGSLPLRHKKLLQAAAEQVSPRTPLWHPAARPFSLPNPSRADALGPRPRSCHTLCNDRSSDGSLRELHAGGRSPARRRCMVVPIRHHCGRRLRIRKNPSSSSAGNMPPIPQHVGLGYGHGTEADRAGPPALDGCGT